MEQKINKVCMYTFVAIIFSVVSCVKKKERPLQVTMNGLNGQAVYVLNQEKKIAVMYKPEYVNDILTIMLDGDTVVLGEHFIASINVRKDKYLIKVSTPTITEISEHSASGPDKYEYLPQRVGIYDFQGTIEYETTVVPFVFKFIVVKKEH